MSTETKIEPCPFCGSQPEITGDCHHRGKSRNPVGRAVCKNVQCGITMIFTGDTFYNIEGMAEAEGIRGITKKWNRRAVKS